MLPQTSSIHDDSQRLLNGRCLGTAETLLQQTYHLDPYISFERVARMTYRKPTWLLIGASGRVGCMLCKHWFQHPPVYGNIVCQFRQVAEQNFTQDVLSWSPLETKKPLLDFSAKHGAPAVIFGFAGVTPASGVDLSMNALMTEAILSAAHEAGVRRVLLASSSFLHLWF